VVQEWYGRNRGRHTATNGVFAGGFRVTWWATVVPEADHWHRRIDDGEKVGVTGHDPLCVMLVGEGKKVVVVRATAHRRDLGRVVQLANGRDDAGQEALAVLVADEAGDLRPTQHVDELRRPGAGMVGTRIDPGRPG
jgi:hypothetical protein